MKVTVKKFPNLRTRIKWKIFPNSWKVGWCWYHILFPEKFLKLFGKEFKPWSYEICADDILENVENAANLIYKRRQL